MHACACARCAHVCEWWGGGGVCGVRMCVRAHVWCSRTCVVCACVCGVRVRSGGGGGGMCACVEARSMWVKVGKLKKSFQVRK